MPVTVIVMILVGMILMGMILVCAQRLADRLSSPYKIGENYFIRSVTYHYTGKLVKVTKSELILMNAAWIADDGRFTEAVATGSFNEVEPYPTGREIVIGRGAIVDALAIDFPLPTKQK